MKKNMVCIARSLDGFIAGRKGDLEWLNAVPNPDHLDALVQDTYRRLRE